MGTIAYFSEKITGQQKKLYRITWSAPNGLCVVEHYVTRRAAREAAKWAKEAGATHIETSMHYTK